MAGAPQDHTVLVLNSVTGGHLGAAGHVHALEKVQRLGARQILRAFKAVALPVLEAEAFLESTARRLQRKAIDQVANFFALSSRHPVKKCAVLFASQGSKYPTPARDIYRAIRRKVEPHKGLPILDNPAWVQAPWTSLAAHVNIPTAEEGAQWVDQAQKRGYWTLFTDGSVRNNRSGAAVVSRMRHTARSTVRWSATIGWSRTCPVLYAELSAIRAAVRMAAKKTPIVTTYIVTDSQEALQAMLRGNKAHRARAILRDIVASIREFQKRSTRSLRFVWVPAHQGIRDNEAADAAAREATAEDKRPTLDYAERVRQLTGVLRSIRQDGTDNPYRNNPLPRHGRYTWSLDLALPGPHTLELYGALSSNEASMLIQARSNKSHLNSSLYRMRVADSAMCECGHDDETIRHVILECPRWVAERSTLKQEVGPRWGDMAFLLGAWTPRQDFLTGKYINGPRDKWKPSLDAVRATLRFMAATGRFTAISKSQLA